MLSFRSAYVVITIDHGEIMATGYLQVDVVSAENNFPITDANISISKTDEPEQILEQITTNRSGQTETVSLEAPPLELSLSPQNLPVLHH